MVEQLTRNEQVAGSIPVFGSRILPLAPDGYNLYTRYIMHIPKNYFHDRIVLLLLSINAFLAAFVTILTLFRLRGGNSEGFVGQYHANLGLSAFQPGSVSTFVSFIVFAVLILVLHTILSMRTYSRRREYSLIVLWMGLVLLLLLLVVSNALSVLQ